jgi:proteasome lid subunit RPN8/RPN11
MKWTEQPPDAQPRPWQDALSGLGVLDVLTLVRAQQRGLAIVVDPACRRRIQSHLETERTELGGLLLGFAFTDPLQRPDQFLVSIHDCVPSRTFSTSRVSLSMDSTIWNETHGRVGPDLGMVVGWYHSHPDLGAFFSSTDRATQRAFFRQPYSLGLVIDPVRGEEAWYVGAEAREVPAAACLLSGRVALPRTTPALPPPLPG